MKTKNPAKRILKTAVIQMQSKPYALNENLQSALNLAKEAHDKGANLIVLPELFDSGYCVSDKDAEFGIDFKAIEHGELKNESLSALSDFAKSNKVHLVACSIEKTNKKLYDSAYIIPSKGK
ncbi:carbon-nitrogen hydrolase family protein, partial [Helicobacter pylori]|uniref:carbon-nitrogen hydrolase family protein n=1 Tax=Helicobacter pylori TaxID=210 RepID=UPI0029276A34